MANELIKALLVEIDGNVEKLRRELRKGEGDLQTFAGKASAAGKTAGMAADVTAQKQANAARAIASATETIARQGEVSGAAAKQLVTQASNAALFWGPKGAVVGAVGISVLAIVGLFTRVKREAAEAADETRKEFEKMASMDLVALSRRRTELEQGDVELRGRLGSVDPRVRAAAREEARADFGRIGRSGLEEERDRLTARRLELGRSAVDLARGPRAARIAAQAERDQIVADLEAIEKVLKATQPIADRLETHIARTAAASGDLAQSQLAITQAEEAAKAEKEARRTRAEAIEDLKQHMGAFSADFERLVLDAMGTAGEKASAVFQKAIADAQRLLLEDSAQGGGQIDRAAVTERIAQLERAKEQAALSADAVERLKAAWQAYEEGATRGAGGSGSLGRAASVALDMERLKAAIEAANDTLLFLTEGTEAYNKLIAERNRLEKEWRDLMQSGEKPPKPPEPTDIADTARAIQQAADGALQLAQNLGGADAAAIGLLRSVVQIAGNVPALANALKAGSGLGVVGAALPIIGALSSLFGQSPEEQQRLDELRKNTEAIRALTKRAGLLGGIDATGADVVGARSSLQGFLGSPFGARALIQGGALREARRYGVDVAELQRIAAAHGITLNESITSFQQLAAALADTITKLGEFGDDLDSQRRQAEAEIQLFGITDPLEQLRIRQRALAGRSSALDAVTGGLDLSTEEGRSQARANAQALFDVLRAGGTRLGADALGGLSGDDLLQALLDLVSSLDAIDSAVTGGGAGSTLGGVSGFRGLSEGAGNRLADYTRSLVGYARESRDLQAEMLGVLQRISGSPLPIPAHPSGVSGGSTFGSGGLVVHLSPGAIVTHLNVYAGDGDPDDVATAVGRVIPRAIEEGLYQAIRRASIAAGDLRIPGGRVS